MIHTLCAYSQEHVLTFCSKVDLLSEGVSDPVLVSSLPSSQDWGGEGGRKKKSGIWIGKREREDVSKDEMESKKEVGHMSKYMHFGHVYIYRNLLKCIYPHYVVLAEVHSPSNSSTC